MEGVKITFGRTTWVEPPCCSFGDYGGAGATGRANIDAILEAAGESVVEFSFEKLGWFEKRTENSRYKPYYQQDEMLECAKELRPRPNVIHVTGDWSSECVLIREGWEEGDDMQSSLADYPVLNDEAETEIEMKWEEEAWKDWAKSDLIKAVGELHEKQEGASGWIEVDLGEWLDTWSDEDLWTWYRAAMEEANVYPTPEHNGSHIPVREIKQAAYKAALEKLKAEIKEKRESALREHLGDQFELMPGGPYLPDRDGVEKAAVEKYLEPWRP